MRAIRDDRWADASLSVLLAVQVLTLFVAIPLGARHPASHLLLDLCHLAFAAICVGVLTRHRAVQVALLAGLALLAVGPVAGDAFAGRLGFSAQAVHETIATNAFLFNGIVTALVARQVFGAGRVTAHHIQGAVLLYLNVAALFAIAYGLLESHFPGAIVPESGGVLSGALGARTAALTYFSLSTITTTGFGDLQPLHPLARSLANFEAVFGQLFPATLLARLVGLHLVHGQQEESRNQDEP
jgi:hypothetical protein